ncbi:HAD family phosphatase [Leptospira sp. 96542]|nr:HAD family phosphatase [Leptospira sp. 96542]
MSVNQTIIAYIFDMDGVVVNNHKYHFQAWIEFSKKYKFALDETIYRNQFNGKTNADLFRMIFGSIANEKILEYSLEKENTYQRLYESEIKPHTGLIDFLSFLKSQQFKIALGTSAPTTNVNFTLDKLGLRQYFDAIVDGSQVTKGKPDPEVYSLCCQKIGVSPNQCLVFEDSLAGLESGKNAGCSVVGVATSHTKEELSGHAHQIIYDFTEIRDLLKI